MMFTKKWITLIVACIFASSTMAAPLFSCPQLETIKSEGLSGVDLLPTLGYFVFNSSQYNTGQEWFFLIAPIFAEDETAALTTGNRILSKMSVPGVPDESSEVPTCFYQTHSEDYIAIASQSPNVSSLLELRNLSQKHHLRH